MMSRSTPLVSQYLENLSGDALQDYQELIRRYIRGRHGIYALYRRSKLYYVGLASNLRSRLKHHLNDRHKGLWDRFSVYLTVGDAHLREMESLLLRISQPRGNRQAGKFHHRCENLRRRFAGDIRREWRSELDHLFGDGEDSGAGEVIVAAEAAGRQPPLAQYLHALGRRTLKAHFKGRTVKARVLRNGQVRHKGKTYNSPSLAAAAACQRRTCNGWSFWTYERAPGDWVSLTELRGR